VWVCVWIERYWKRKERNQWLSCSVTVKVGEESIIRLKNGVFEKRWVWNLYHRNVRKLRRKKLQHGRVRVTTCVYVSNHFLCCCYFASASVSVSAIIFITQTSYLSFIHSRTNTPLDYVSRLHAGIIRVKILTKIGALFLDSAIFLCAYNCRTWNFDKSTFGEQNKFIGINYETKNEK